MLNECQLAIMNNIPPTCSFAPSLNSRSSPVKSQGSGLWVHQPRLLPRPPHLPASIPVCLWICVFGKQAVPSEYLQHIVSALRAHIPFLYFPSKFWSGSIPQVPWVGAECSRARFGHSLLSLTLEMSCLSFAHFCFSVQLHHQVRAST